LNLVLCPEAGNKKKGGREEEERNRK